MNLMSQMSLKNQKILKNLRCHLFLKFLKYHLHLRGLKCPKYQEYLGLLEDLYLL
jgi:hypothetical protein